MTGTTGLSYTDGLYKERSSRAGSAAIPNTAILDSFLGGPVTTRTQVKVDATGDEMRVLGAMHDSMERARSLNSFMRSRPKCSKAMAYRAEALWAMIARLGVDTRTKAHQDRRNYKLDAKCPKDSSRPVAHPSAVDLPSGATEESLTICLFSHSAHLAGAERSLLELTSELIAEHGVVSSVVLPCDGPLKGKLDKLGASTMIVEYSWWCDWSLPPDVEMHNRLRNSYRALLRVMDQIEMMNPDVILTNTLVMPWGAVVASLLGKPHVWMVHEFGQLDHGLRFFLPFGEVLAHIEESSNLIFTFSRAVADQLFGNTRSGKVVTLRHHVDIPSDALSSIPRRHFTRRHATKLVIVGDIRESKGQIDAVLAVRRLVQRGRDVELLVVGPASPGYLESLQAIVQEESLERHVRFLGFQENVYPIINQADIALMCSKFEAFGRFTVEAMLLSKPVVGTNSGGTPELIEDGFNGFLYEAGNHHELADRIDYLIDRREKIRELGEHGRRFAESEFTRERYGGRAYELLKALQGAPNHSWLPYFGAVPRTTRTPIGEMDGFGVMEPEDALREVSVDRSVARQVAQREPAVRALSERLALVTEDLENVRLQLDTILASKTWRIAERALRIYQLAERFAQVVFRRLSRLRLVIRDRGPADRDRGHQ